MRKTMAGFVGVALAAAVLAGLFNWSAAPGSVMGKREYKVVVLGVESSSMPDISKALNDEVERGYKLTAMSVIPPGKMYLVFEK